MLTERISRSSRRDVARLAMLMSVSAIAPSRAQASAAVDADFDAVAALATHPIIGRWLAVTAFGPADLSFDSGGNVLVVWPHSGDDAQGGYYEFSTSAAGVWRPSSASEADIVVVMGDIDDSGLVSGATTMESHVVVDADQGEFRCVGANHRVLRATFALEPALDLITTLAPMSGIRMWAE